MQGMLPHSLNYFEQVAEIAKVLDWEAVERLAARLSRLRTRGGRLFLLGVGGSAAHCSHAVDDFRKRAGIEAYSPSELVGDPTAQSFEQNWASWLRTNRANENDAVLVLSFEDGASEDSSNTNIDKALDEAKRRGLDVYGIVGREGGSTARVGDEVIVVPTVDEALPSRAFQAVIWHCLVCHPKLMIHSNTWEIRNSESDGLERHASSTLHG